MELSNLAKRLWKQFRRNAILVPLAASFYFVARGNEALENLPKNYRDYIESVAVRSTLCTKQETGGRPIYHPKEGIVLAKQLYPTSHEKGVLPKKSPHSSLELDVLDRNDGSFHYDILQVDGPDIHREFFSDDRIHIHSAEWLENNKIILNVEAEGHGHGGSLIIADPQSGSLEKLVEGHGIERNELVAIGHNKLYFLSDRDKSFYVESNLYSMDLETWEITQVQEITNITGQEMIEKYSWGSLLAIATSIIMLYGLRHHSKTRKGRHPIDRAGYDLPELTKPIPMIITLETIIDKIVSRPLLSSAAIAGAILYSGNYLTPLVSPIPKPALKSLMYLTTASIYTSITAIGTVALGNFGDMRTPILSNWCRFLKNLMTTKQPQRTILERINFEKYESPGVLYEKAQFALHKQPPDFDAFLYNLSSCLDLGLLELASDLSSLDVMNRMSATLSHRLNVLKESALNRESATNIELIGYEVSSAFSHLLHKDQTNFRKTFESILSSNPPHEAELRLVYAESLSMLGQQEESEVHAKQALEELFSKELPFHQIGSYQVYTIPLTNYLGRRLIVKASEEKETLTSEVQNLRHLSEKLRDTGGIDAHNYRVANPFAVIEHQGKYYLIETRAEGETLQEIFSEQKDYEALARATRLLGLTHGLMPQDTSHPDYGEILSKAIKGMQAAGMNASAAGAVYYAVLPLADDFRKGMLVFDKDAHGDNFMKDKFGRIHLFDMPSRGYIPPEFDLGKLHSQGRIFDNSSEGLDLRIAMLHEHYLPMFNRCSRKSIPAEDAFIARCFKATVFKSLTHYSYMCRRGFDDGLTRPFFDNAVFATEVLEDRFSDYCSQQELRSFPTIRKSLKELHI